MQFGVNFFSLAKSPPAKQIADLLSYETKQKYRVIPVASAGTQFTIAMVNPDDLIALDAVRVELKSGHLKKVVCTADEFEFFMRDLYETEAEAPVAQAETPKPATKVAAKTHLKALFGDDDDDDEDDDEDKESAAVAPTAAEPVIPPMPLPTVSPAAAALSAKLASSIKDDDDDFDDDDDSDIPMPTVKPARKPAPLAAAPAAVQDPVATGLDDEAPILNIDTPTINVVSQVSAALKQDQPGSNGNGTVHEPAPAAPSGAAALPPAFGLEAAKAFGLDDDDDDDSDIPLPTVQPRKPAASVAPAMPAAQAALAPKAAPVVAPPPAPAPAPAPVHVVAPVVAPAAPAPVAFEAPISAPAAVAPPLATPRKPAASVTAHYFARS